MTTAAPNVTNEQSINLKSAFDEVNEKSSWSSLREDWSKASRKEKIVIASIVATAPVSVPLIALGLGAAIWYVGKIPCAASGGY